MKVQKLRTVYDQIAKWPFFEAFLGRGLKNHRKTPSGSNFVLDRGLLGSSGGLLGGLAQLPAKHTEKIALPIDCFFFMGFRVRITTKLVLVLQILRRTSFHSRWGLGNRTGACPSIHPNFFLEKILQIFEKIEFYA